MIIDKILVNYRINRDSNIEYKCLMHLSWMSKNNALVSGNTTVCELEVG